MTSGFLLLLGVGGVGTALVGSLLLLRHQDQRIRDRRRVVALVEFPRSVTTEQVVAFVAALQGLAAVRTGLLGRDSAALEVVGTYRGITHRLRLPKTSSAYFIGQLRATVPGVTVTPLESDDPHTALPRLHEARELRLTDTTRALSVEDASAVSRTVLAACSGLGKGDTIVWQWLVLGGRRLADADRTSWLTLIERALWRSNAEEPAATGKQRKDPAGVTAAVLRIGARGPSRKRSRALVARLSRASASVAAPKVRLLPRLLPNRLTTVRLREAATPLIEAPIAVSVKELVALLGWPIAAPVIPGLVLGSSPQLLAAPSVPKSGRVLGDANVGAKRPVALSRKAALEHALFAGPTGSGKSWLAANLALGDIGRGDGVLVIDPKGGTVRAILERLPEDAIERTILVDPTDEQRVVPLPLLSPEQGGIPELAADTLVGLLRHRYHDLGPRSSDILTSSLYALARVPDATFMDLLPLWSDARFRASVAGRSKDDPVLASFFGWFDGLGASERNFVLAAPMNKIRPLLQRRLVRNVLAAPKATFTMAEALAGRCVVLVSLPEGVLGSDVTSLLGQVVVARLWAAVQGRVRLPEAARRPFFVTVDEAPRFIDQPTDLGDVLARSREYAVGVTLIGQSLAQFPTSVRDIALNSARTKVAFQSSAGDARRLAAEFGPTVTPDMLLGLRSFEAIGVVSVGGAVSEPFTFKARELPDKQPGRAAAVRRASRERWGVDRADIEASFVRRDSEPPSAGAIRRRVER